MKKLMLLSFVSMMMFIPQVYSISLADYIQQNGMPQVDQYGELSLSGKNLTDLTGFQSIPDLDRVRLLFLGDNKLQTLPTYIFSGLNNLSAINLDNNQLKTLPADIFNGLKNLGSLYLKDNPFRPDFLLSLPTIIKSIPSLRQLDGKRVDEALESYRIYNPKSLLKISAGSVLKNFTPEQLENLAKTNYTAFNLLPLSQNEKMAILRKVAAKLARAGDPAFDFLPLPKAVRRAIMKIWVFAVQPIQPAPAGRGPATLKESALKYITQDITLKELEQIAEINPEAFDLLPLSKSVKKVILERIAEK